MTVAEHMISEYARREQSNVHAVTFDELVAMQDAIGVEADTDAQADRLNAQLRDLAELMVARIRRSPAPTSRDMAFMDWVHTGGCSFDPLPLAEGDAYLDVVDHELFPRAAVADQCDYLNELFDEFAADAGDEDKEDYWRHGPPSYYQRFLKLFEEEGGLADRLLQMTMDDVDALVGRAYQGLGDDATNNLAQWHSSTLDRIYKFVCRLDESYHDQAPIHDRLGLIDAHFTEIGFFAPPARQLSLPLAVKAGASPA